VPSQYLQIGDAATYGLPNTTQVSDIINASAVIDAYLGRTEGLVWQPDFNGLPCYMAGLNPSYATTLPVALTAGQAATFAYPPVTVGSANLIGETLVIDRAGTCEIVSITGVNAQAGTITITAPATSHAQGVTLEQGMTITEERAIAPKRSTTRTSRFPVTRLVSGCGRYSYGRRSDQVAGLYNDVNLVAAVQTFGGPPIWIPFDVRSADVRAATGEVWVPAGLLLAYYTDVCLRYVAGYPVAGLPPAIKQACANIIASTQASQYAPAAFKVAQAGGTKFERWSESQIDADTRNLLEPFRQKLFF
jgi:hypothetical protein